MGEFNDYLESLKKTPEYMAAKVYDEFSNSVWRIRRQKGIKQKEIAEKMGVSPSYISTVLNGHRKTLLLSAVCKIAHALDCDVKIEFVPKPIPGKNYTLPDDLDADGTVKNKPLPNEQNADGTLKNAVFRALTEPELEAHGTGVRE